MSDTNKNCLRQESVAIVGGGMMGIAAALYLAEDMGYRVTLFEKENQLGGLSSFYQWREVIWDRFYHVILSTDTHLINFINKLDLQDDLFWRETKSGFYGEGKLVSFSSALDFAFFPFMSVWQKFRMAFGILYTSWIKDPSRLDKIYVRQWLTKVFGNRVYENIWDPLLRSKFGEARERTSAAFIWAAINRLYGARNSGNKVEKMGHVRGGYYSILRAVERKLYELGVTVATNTPVLNLEAYTDLNPLAENGKTHLLQPHQGKKKFSLITNASRLKFDKVLFTIDCPEALRILGSINEASYWRQLRQVEYLSVICVFLILNRKLSPYYVINLLDKDLPFTGIIEATNVVSPEDLGDKHLVYLPKYMSADNHMNSLNDDKIVDLFIENLKKVFPDLKNKEILHKQIFRATYVQPIQELNFLDRITDFRTPMQGLYLANTSMIYNSTLNNNAVVSLARKAAKAIVNDTKQLKQ